MPPSPSSRGRAHPVALAVLVATLCGSAACADAAPRTSTAGVESAPVHDTAFPVAAPDGAAGDLRFSEPPRRILSLVPSATRVLQALGQEHRLVGRTDYDTAGSLARLPSVGGGLGPSLEVVAALRPDLVIRFAGEQDTRTAARLDDLGIAHLAVRPDRIDDVRDVIRELGRIVGVPGMADSLVATLDSTLAAVRSAVEGRPPPAVAYVVGGNPPWVAGPGTFVDEAIRAAGGENAFADLGHLYAPVSVEELVARRIDVILVPPGSRLDLPTGRAEVRGIPPGLEAPGPGLADAVRGLARILHPSAFP